MAEETTPKEPKKEVHPGSWLGDAAEEWKKLPTWGKWTVGIIFLAVIGFAIYELYLNNQASQGAATTQAAGPGTSGAGAGAGAGAGTDGASQSAYPQTSSGGTGTVPILPQGIQPVFDANGNLIAFGPTSTTAATVAATSPSPSPETAPAPTVQPPGVGRVTQRPPTPKVANATGKPSENLSTIQAFLKAFGLGKATVTKVGTGEQSGYLIKGAPGLNQTALASRFGKGWSVSNGAPGYYLVKGPNAVNVKIAGTKVTT